METGGWSVQLLFEILQIPFPKDLSVSDHPGLTVQLEGYMALALAQYEDLFQLVSGYLYWRKNGLPNRVQDNLYSYVYSHDEIVPFDRGGSYIYLPSESNGPNLLDEPLKSFIVNPANLPWQWVKRLITLGERVNHNSQ